MKILVIGSGGREHALVWALANSDSKPRIWALPGNPGISKIATLIPGSYKPFENTLKICRDLAIDLVVIGPEQPLAEGLSDYLREFGIPVFGPSMSASMLESSKGFAKDFMIKYDIPTAAYIKFNKADYDKAMNYAESANHPLVIKVDGLAQGKGVFIANDINESQNTIESIFAGTFGDSGNSIVIEEFINGNEASILAVSNGSDFIILPSSQDHKRAFDNDIGPNTGGMGAYSPAPIITPALLEIISDTVIRKAIDGMQNEGTPFIGCLYAGLMIANGQPYVIEFNVRFGDPETQAVLPIFDEDLARLFSEAAMGKSFSNEFKSNNLQSNKHSCCVVLCSEGYPGKYDTGKIIEGLDSFKSDEIILFHAGTAFSNDEVVTSGGRVLGISGIGNTLEEAIAKAYSGVELISFENKFYRKDIGSKAIIKHNS